MEQKKLSRRDFLRGAAMTAAGVALAACAAPTPQIIEKEVPVEKVVKETVVVEKQVPIEKVVKETVVVEKKVEVVKGGFVTPREETVIINETGILRVYESANPFVPNATVGGYGQVCGSYLFFLNWATGESVNKLASGYEYNKDFTKMTIKTRPEAHWNDGKPFTAQDIAFTVNMLKADTSVSWGATMDRYVDKVEATDDHTVVFTLKAPNPRFHWLFKQSGSLPIQPKHIWEGKDLKTFKNFPPVGTGPYKYYMGVPEQRMHVWVRDDNYWGKALGYEPGPKYYIYQNGPPPEGEIQDIADNFIDHAHGYTSDAKLLRRTQELNKEVVLAPWRDPCPRGIWFNCAKYPLSKPEVRWAFHHCIDKEKAAKSLYPWPTVPAKYPWADWGSHDPFNYEDVLAQFDTSFDVNKGAKILDDLGFKKGPDGIRVDDQGNKMSYTIVVPSQGVTGEYPIAMDFAENLGKIGVQAQVKWVEGPTWDDMLQTGQFDISSSWWCGNWQEPPMSFNWQTYMLAPIGERAVKGNWPRVNDPEIDKVFAKLEVMSPDDPAIVPYYKEAYRLYMKNMPGVPVVQTTYVMPFNTHYWKGWPEEGKIDVVPFTWWTSFRFVLFKLRKA